VAEITLTQAQADLLRRTNRNEFRRFQTLGLIDRYGNVVPQTKQASIQSTMEEAGEICNDFPEWQKELNDKRFASDNIASREPIPVYQDQPPLITSDNERDLSTVKEAHFRSFRGSFGAGAISTSAGYIVPSFSYDTIRIAAFESTSPSVAVAFPICVRFGKAALLGANLFPNAQLDLFIGGDLTVVKFAPNQVANFPDVIATQRTPDNYLEISVEKTNKPFTFWFWHRDVAEATLALHWSVMIGCKER
jgi:hypothetical protein